MKWASEHRRHHRKVDTNEDPYTIKKGFWYAHIGWLFFKEEPRYQGQYADDLKADWMVRLQHNYYRAIAIFVGFGIPTLIGWAFGDALGGFLWGGILRIVICHHFTFFINSLCHMWGRQTYSDTVTARDNSFLAVLTYGGGVSQFPSYF